MKTYRTLLAAAFVAVFVTGCVPPLTKLKVDTVAAPCTAFICPSVSVDAGQSVVLHWSGTTLMPYSDGQAAMNSRVYKITPNDPYASPLTIAENCTVSAGWACLHTPRNGTFTIDPYVSGTYTLTADETVTAILPPAPATTFSARPVRVTVTVNRDVAIADVIGHVTDARLKSCINALGLTYVREVMDLNCVGATFGPFITSLAGLEHFYALENLNISNNLLGLDTVHKLAPSYMDNPASVNLYKSGLSCVNQNAIATALVAKNPAVVVTKGISPSNLCL